MYFNMIGAGRLGKILANSLIQNKQAELKAVCNQSLHSAQEAVQHIGMGIAVSSFAELPLADITFITSCDDAIPLIAKQLATEAPLLAKTTIAHCSGVLSSAELIPLHTIHCSIASIHPLRAFRANHFSPLAFQDCDCVVEGDSLALQVLCPLFESLGAKPILINSEAKASYHAAAVFAANYLVPLAGIAIKLFCQADIPQETAKNMATNLMASSLNNIIAAPTLTQALTGPLQRGDISTIKKHLQALSDEQMHSFYCIAAKASLQWAGLAPEIEDQLRDLLS